MVKVSYRYLVFEILWKRGGAPVAFGFDKKHLVNAIFDSLAENFGSHGAGTNSGSLFIQYYNPVTNLFAVKCLNDQHKQVWLSASLITHLGFEPVLIILRKVTGVFRECKRCVVNATKWTKRNVALTDQMAKQMEEEDKNFQISF